MNDTRLVREQFDLMSNATTIDVIYSASLASVDVPVPPLREQESIVEFLECETAKIDALIGKQEQLIATLREHRTATMTSVVTKGLDPDVEMKDSGVEWIGALPSHWAHALVKYACAILTGFPFKSEGFTDDADDLPLLRGTNVGVNLIDWTDVVYWPRSEASAFAEYKLQPGDIVMGLDRPFISAGIRVSRIGAHDVPSLLLQRVARMRVSSEFEQDYLFYLLTGPGIVHHLTPIFTGVSVPHVSPDQVAAFPIPQPPLEEQRRIVDYLAKRCAEIDVLTKKAQQSVEILREYRSALITDAVTGKIDVRGAA
jgi:type I restriction enzyme S subunit